MKEEFRKKVAAFALTVFVLAFEGVLSSGSPETGLTESNGHGVRRLVVPKACHSGM
jgi:hypothetical protein